MNVEYLDKAIAGALCPTFQTLVEAGSTVSVLSLAAGPLSAPIQKVSLPVTALSMLGAAAACPEAEIGINQGPCVSIDGCKRVENGQGALEAKLPEWSAWLPQGVNDCVEIVSVSSVYENGSLWGRDLTLKTKSEPAGFVKTINGQTEEEAANLTFRINVISGTCADDCSGPPEPDVPVHTYQDPVTNCTYNVKFEGLLQEYEGGPISPVYQISSGAETRAGGGRMGGCYFDPVIYTPGPNGPGGPGGPTIPPIPVPPNPPLPDGDGVPWWAAPLLSGATSAALNLIGQELAKLSEPDFLPGSFTLTAPCDKNEDGTPEYRTWSFAQGSFQQRMNAHQVAIMEMIQQHLNWKTPVCKDEKPQLEGDWRTISFVSDTTSPYGKSRLRKRFRYRSVSGSTLSAVVDHWKDFYWQSGPVCVIHSGSSWGTPQVWAVTADEGKRVIRHAAGEAGIDPDQTGRWTISSSDSARFGVSDTMRIETKGGYYWITARDGSNQRPIVMTVPPP